VTGKVYFAKSFGFGVLFERECREVDSGPEHFGLCEDTDTTHSVDFHLHIWVAVGVAEVGQVRPPCGILGVTFDNNGIFVERIRKRESGFGLLPRVQIVGLFATEPVRKRTPDI
jgi:hypothetical protein